MRKICFIFCSVLSLPFAAQSQVLFNELPLQQAFAEAKSTGRIVVMMVESEQCKTCNEIVATALLNPPAGNLYNQKGVAIRINKKSKDYALADSLYEIKGIFGMFFLDTDGTLLNRFAAGTPVYQPYIIEFNKAMANKLNPDIAYKSALAKYNSGDRSFQVLYEMVRKKNEWNMERDSLTEAMVKIAHEDSATSLSFIRFVAEQCPAINSAADRYMRSKSAFSAAWNTIPLQKRIDINNRIIVKSRARAITAKDIAYARRVAGFAAGTNTDSVAVIKSYQTNMMAYFRGIRDTTNYLGMAIGYYDQYYMSKNVDSVLKSDSVRRVEFMTQRMAAMAGKGTPTKTEGAVMVTPGPMRPDPSVPVFYPAATLLAQDLTSGARGIYDFITGRTATEKALEWSKRAVELAPNPGSLDTYSRLLYRLNRKSEAIEAQEKIIAFSKKYGIPLTQYESTLQKMREGLPISETVH